MNLFKLLVAGAAVGVILAAFRDFENDTWLLPGAAPRSEDEEEPILGYDGMDQETLLDWIGEAQLDPATLRRIHGYERANRRREPVLAAVSDLL